MLEDDLVTSVFFLKFMNEALTIFKDREDIGSITGFSFASKLMNFPKKYDESIFLNIRPMSWSWATWKNSWGGIDWEVKSYQEFITDSKKIKKFHQGGTDLTNMLRAQMEGRVDSWYVRWSFHMILNNKFTVYPTISFVNNVGFDGTGVHRHKDKSNILNNPELNQNSQLVLNKNIQLNKTIVSRFNKVFNMNIKGQLIFMIKRILGL